MAVKRGRLQDSFMNVAECQLCIREWLKGKRTCNIAALLVPTEQWTRGSTPSARDLSCDDLVDLVSRFAALDATIHPRQMHLATAIYSENECRLIEKLPALFVAQDNFPGGAPLSLARKIVFVFSKYRELVQYAEKRAALNVKASPPRIFACSRKTLFY